MPTNSPTQFILDLTGVAPSNLVKNELQTVSSAQYNDHHIIVPNFAPFYVDNFKLKLRLNGEERLLVEDVDYSFTLSYVTGTRTTGKNMYGAISIHNLDINGILELEYQTIGGDQVCDRLYVLTYLADKAYNPRTTIWDIITNVPNALPPAPHYQNYDTFYGQEAVVTKLGEIRDAISSNSSLTSDQIRTFLEQLKSISLTNFVLRSGSTMEGPLFLKGDPVEDKEAATKHYVDATTVSNNELATTLSNYPTNSDMNTQLNNKLNLSGGTMTGPIVLNAPPTQDMQAANKAYIDNRIQLLESELNDLRSQLGSIGGSYITRTEVEDMISEVMIRITNVS